MQHLPARFPRTTLTKAFYPLTRSSKLAAVVVCLLPFLCGHAFAQSMSTFAGLNTVGNRSNPTAAPDVTIAVETLQYCEHVNSSYQCWYKGGTQANQPVRFLGNTNPKS